jgi:hypothetical protein
LGDTIEERLSSRTTSKSRFKSDTWPFKVARNVESKNMAMATRRTNPNIYRENNALYSKTPQPTRLTPQQLEERKEKGL